MMFGFFKRKTIKTETEMDKAISNIMMAQNQIIKDMTDIQIEVEEQKKRIKELKTLQKKVRL